MTGCLSDINNLRILQLLHRNLQLMFDSPSLLFYLDVLESFSNYYFVMFSLLLLLECVMKTLYNELIMTLPNYMVLHFLRFKFQLLSTSAMELTVIKVTGCNVIMRLQRVTRDNSGLQGITGGTRGLQGITVGYKELQGLQGVTEGYKRLQGVTRG